MGMHFKLGLYEHQSAGAIGGLIDLIAAHPPLVADPAAPTEIARRMTDLSPVDRRDGSDGKDGSDRSDGWDITVVSEPFTTGSEDVETAMGRLQDHARQREWEIVVGLTELPLHDDEGRHLLIETDPEQRTAVLSLPALGGFRIHTRTRRALRSLVSGILLKTSIRQPIRPRRMGCPIDTP